MSDNSELKKYKISVMMPAGNGDCSYENTISCDSIVVDGETNIFMVGDEIQAIYPARYTIIELIK